MKIQLEKGQTDNFENDCLNLAENVFPQGKK